MGIAEFGDLRGTPVIYFHGFPGSRLEARLIDGTARELGMRIIAVDRPGYGLSEAARACTIGQWPENIARLTDLLDIPRFCVIGISGGGPYALACAAGLPQRVSAVAVVCGLGPLHFSESTAGMARGRRQACALARHFPWIVWPAAALIARRIRKDLSGMFEDLTSRVSEPDQHALRQPGLRESLERSFRESVRQGSAGCARDLAHYLRAWDFCVEKIEAPLTFWHGERDAIVPAAMSRNLASRISHAAANYLPEEGHYSVVMSHAPKILRELRERSVASA